MASLGHVSAFLLLLLILSEASTTNAWLWRHHHRGHGHGYGGGRGHHHEKPLKEISWIQNRKVAETQQVQVVDPCAVPPTCVPGGAYVECVNGGRIGCMCTWVSKCKPTASECYFHTTIKNFTSCGF